MNKKLLFLMFGMIMFFSLISASDLVSLEDNLKQIDSKTSVNPFGYKKLVYEPITTDKIIADKFMLKEESLNYPVLRISNTFLWITTDKIAEYKLIDIKESIINIEMYGKAVLYKDSKLFDSSEFYNLNGIKKDYPYQYYYKVTEEWVSEDVVDYNEICPIVKEPLDTKIIKGENSTNNSTNETLCTYEPIYENVTHSKTYWKEYNFETLEAGNYEWKIEAKKEINKAVDLVPKALGIELDEYAWFNESWDYRREISNLTGNLSGLYVIDYDAHMQNDFDDLRFVNDAGDVEYDAGYTKKVDGDYIAVRLNNEGNESVYMYYGNSGASSNWNMSNVYFDPVAFYPLDENANDYVGSNDGTVSGATLSSGYINGSYDFDGSNDYISITDSDSIEPDYITYTFWVNLDSTNLDGGFIGKAGTNPLYLSSQGTVTTSTYTIKNHITTTAGYSNLETDALNTDEWYHVAVTYNGSNQNVYINGALNKSVSKTGTIITSSNPLIIGRDTSNTKYSNCKIDEVLIYDKALTSTQIEALYNQTAPNFITGDEEENKGSVSIDYVTPPTKANNTNYSQTYIPIEVLPVYTNASIINVTYSLYDSSDTLEDEVTYTDETYSINFTELSDDTYHYNVTLYAEESIRNTTVNASTDTRYITLDATAPEINISSPLTSYDYLYDNQTIDLNYSVVDEAGHLDSCWYEYNGTLTDLNCSDNTTFQYIVGVDNLTLYANDTLGNEGSSFVEWTRLFTKLNLTYNNETYEGLQSTFSVNMELNDSISLQQSYLQYNDTNYTTSVSYSGGVYSISSTIYPPLITNDTNVTFSFWFNVGGEWYNLLNETQLLLAVTLGVCSPTDDIMLNLSLLEEKTKTPINGTIEINALITNKLTSTTIEETNITFNDVSNAFVCLTPTDSYKNYYLYSEIRYLKEDTHVPELYHIQKADLSDYPKNLSLYDLSINDSTEFLVTYKDENFVGVRGAIIQLLRKYIGEGVYYVVEAPKTSKDGETVLHIDLNSILYRANVVKDGVVLDTFDNLNFHCENEFSGVCKLELKGDVNPENIVDVETLDDFSYTITESNNIITTQYSIPSGVSSDIVITMTQTDAYGNKTICNQSIVSSAGSVDCEYIDTITESYITLEVTKDGDLKAYKTYLIQGSDHINFLNNNYFIVIVLLLSLVGMAFTSPEWTIILSILTFLFAGGLYLLNGLSFVTGIGGLIWLIIASIIIITKLTNQEDR